MNILIVESENDEFFIRGLLAKMNQKADVCYIDEYKHSSLDKVKLTTQIGSAIAEINRGVSRIGIILDLDEDNTENRLKFVNNCVDDAFNESTYDFEKVEPLEKPNEFIEIKIEGYEPIKIACHFTNVDGNGELETVLKAIKPKDKDSHFADCLIEGWQSCIEKKGKIIAPKGKTGDITEKEILKLWVDFYKRFDTLKKGDRNQDNTDWKGIWIGKTQANKKEKDVIARGSTIFDLDSEILSDLKTFLRLFN